MTFTVSARLLVKDLTPPLLLRAYQRIRGKTLQFDGDFADWEAARSKSSGYGSDEIFEKTRAAALQVKNGKAVFDRDAVVFDHVEYSFPMVAALLRVAYSRGGRLHVLDYGGSLGSGYRQFKSFCPDLEHLSWKVIEQPRIVECGRELFRNDELDFFSTIEEALDDATPDVVLLSSVLQYLPDPHALIGKLISLNAASLVVDRTPIGDFLEDLLTVQTVPASIYSASYPCWIFARKKFVSSFLPCYSVLAQAHDASAAWRCGRGDFRFDGIIFSRQEN